MRYIRTKDGVFEVVIEDDEIEMFQVKRNFDSVEYKDVIAKSDTIDKLCDEFVWVKHLGDQTFRKLYKGIDAQNNVLIGDDEKLHYQPRKELEIYGAIWTEGRHGEPILKPVARMNEKGEFKLI